MTAVTQHSTLIDLRSDTVTLPTPPMRAVMSAAHVGDDFYGEDPTVKELEKAGAEILGKEAGLFVPSGTMGNLLAHLTHCPGGAEVVGPEPAHTFGNETGGPSRLAGMTVRSVPQRGGELDVDQIRVQTRREGASLLTQPSGLFWVEQATRGYVVPSDQLADLRRHADAEGLPIHMDGARIFNAAVASRTTAAEIASFADTVMFCVSKALAAPVGSLLVGPAEFVRRARLNRQMLGGGMRQAGVVAAAGLYALRNNIDRLAEDHDNARRLADGLAMLPGLKIDRPIVETNIFFVDCEWTDRSAQEFARELGEGGVLVNTPVPGKNRIRFVTHLGIDRGDIDKTLEIAAAAARGPVHQ